MAKKINGVVIRQKMLIKVAPLIAQKWNTTITKLAIIEAQRLYDDLCADHADESKAVQKHTRAMIYPSISLYVALQHVGIEKEEALEFMDVCCSRLAEIRANDIRMLMQLPGLYRCAPAIFGYVASHRFGEAAGFRATFYPEQGKGRFDMTHCLYHEVCVREGCPELTVCFCHTDDVTCGNMHPKVCWHRAQTIGEGAEYCDFELSLKE